MLFSTTELFSKSDLGVSRHRKKTNSKILPGSGYQVGWVSSYCKVHTLCKDGHLHHRAWGEHRLWVLGLPALLVTCSDTVSFCLAPASFHGTKHRLSLFCEGQAQARGLLCNPEGLSLICRAHTASWAWWYMLGIPLVVRWEVEAGGSQELTEQLVWQIW